MTSPADHRDHSMFLLTAGPAVFEQEMGRPATGVELATVDMWRAEDELRQVEADAEHLRARQAALEVERDRCLLRLDRCRAARDAAGLDDMASHAPELSEVDRELAQLKLERLSE